MASPNELATDVISEDRLVDVWPDYPCLYDVRSTDFKNRDKRQQAFEKIAQEVNQTGMGQDENTSSSEQLYTKAKKPQSSGSARKNPTKRTAWLLEKLQFLAPHVASRPSMTNLDSPSPIATTEDEGAVEDNSSNGEADDLDGSIVTNLSSSNAIPPKHKQRPKSLKKKREEEEYELIKDIASSFKTRRPSEDNVADPFCQYVSNSLKELDNTTRHIAQNAITNILFQAQMGILNQGNQSMLTPSYAPQPQYHQMIPPQQYYPALRRPMSTDEPRPEQSGGQSNELFQL